MHRGITHGIGGLIALPFLTAATLIVCEKLRPSNDGPAVRFWPLVLVAFIGGLAHSLLDLATSYGTRIFEPLSNRWFYGDSLFIVDPLIWIALIVGFEWSRARDRGERDGRTPALAALAAVFVYTAFNLGLTERVEAAARARLTTLHPTLVVANPEPLQFWKRRILWRNDRVYGFGRYDPVRGLRLDSSSHPNGLDDQRLARARRSQPHVRAFLFWSRMPVLFSLDGKTYLTDQRFIDNHSRPRSKGPFLIPLD